MSIALTLSGGGFRATLFHLGVIEQLRSQGLLEPVREVTGVSGGAVMAAHLVLHWKAYTGTQAEFDNAAQHLVKFCQSDVRGAVTRRLLLRTFGLQGFPSWRSIRLLESQYARLTESVRFADLPSNAPGLALVGASLSTGQMVVFHSQGVRVCPAMDTPGRSVEQIHDSPDSSTLLATALAASAAYPLLSSPLRISQADLTPGLGGEHLITDGGLYDNLGIMWAAIDSPRRAAGPLQMLYASDGGRPFDGPAHFSLFDRSPSLANWVWRNYRGIDIPMERLKAYDLREVLQAVIDHRLFQISETYAPAPNRLNLAEQRFCALIRTDLDAFSDDEVQALRLHGRTVVEEAI